MPKLKKTDNATGNETGPQTTADNVSAEWTALAAALFPRKFSFGDIEMVVGETPATALEYLIAYGARQSSIDTEAGRGSFIGQLANGTVPKNAWGKDDRLAIAKDLMPDGYNDENMDHRTALADAYFAKQTAAKWDRIVAGTLTVEGRGPKLSPDEVWLFTQAESTYLAKIGGPSTKTGKIEAAKKKPELADAKPDVVWRWIVNQFLAGNRTMFEAQLAEHKARQSTIETVDVEF